MASPATNQDLYLHIRVVVSIIVGLCITTLLNGFARFVQHPRRMRPSLLHIGWAFSMLLWIIHFWWWEFRLSLVTQWTFTSYSFVILYAILFYSLCTLLFPSDLNDYAGYEAYFISRRTWFFSLLATTFIADIFDTQLKGAAYLHSFGTEYAVRIAVNLAICVAGIVIANRRAQLGLLATSFAYHLFAIVTLYFVE